MATRCTSSGVDKNVDLVTSFSGVPHIVTSVSAVNPGSGYSAPMKELLFWASEGPPDLDDARQWDDHAAQDTNLLGRRNTEQMHLERRFPVWIQFGEYPSCRGSTISVTLPPTIAR